MNNRAQELMHIANSHLKQDVLASADSEFYKNGAWSTGILPLDALLDGGFNKGRFSLLAGESATLKSYIGLSTAIQVQKQGGTAAIIDTEHAFNPDWAKEIGGDLSSLIVSQPETGELGIDTMEVLIREGIDYICFDSIAALLPKSEREIQLSGKDNPQPARIAALMSLALRKLNAANKKTSVVWISQLRDNIGAMAFAPKTNVTGGKAIHYYISQSVMLKKAGKVQKEIHYYNGEKDVLDRQVVTQNFRAELHKSRTGQPFKLQHFNFELLDGSIDIPGYLIAQNLELGTITKKGAWWNYVKVDDDGVVLAEHKAGSKDKFKELVATDPTVYADLLDNVTEHYKLDKDNYV